MSRKQKGAGLREEEETGAGIRRPREEDGPFRTVVGRIVMLPGMRGDDLREEDGPFRTMVGRIVMRPGMRGDDLREEEGPSPFSEGPGRRTGLSELSWVAS